MEDVATLAQPAAGQEKKKKTTTNKKKKGQLQQSSPVGSPATRARRSRNKTLASSSPSKHHEDMSDDPSEAVAQALHFGSTHHQPSSPLTTSSSRSGSSKLGSSNSSTSLHHTSRTTPSSSSAAAAAAAAAAAPADAPKRGRFRASTAATTSSPALLSLLDKSNAGSAPTPAPSPALRGGGGGGASPSTLRRVLGLSRSPQPQRKRSQPLASLPSSPSSSRGGRRLLDAAEDNVEEEEEDDDDDDGDSGDSNEDDLNIFSPRVGEDDDDRAEDWDFLRRKRNEDMGQHEMHDRSFSSSVWCNVCKRKIRGKQRQGKMCTVCRYVTHFECEHDAERNCPTTFSVYPLPSAAPEDVRRMGHAWIEGNHSSSPCLFCSKEVSGRELVGSRCYWCHGVAHNECRDQNTGAVCDFGALRSLKLPPYAIYRTGMEEPELAWKLEPSYLAGTDCKPLLVFINRMSGGQQGHGVIQRLSSLLNPNQIIDIRQGGPAVGLSMFMPLIEKANGFRVLICGGDGTVNWVCTALAKIQFPTEESMPQLGLLPLGTGNDLCGFLGWGTGYTGGDLYKIVERMNTAVPIKLDRWKVRIMETAILKGSKIISFKKKHTPAHSSHAASVTATPVASAAVDHSALLRSAPPKLSNGHERDQLKTVSSSSSLSSSPPTSPPPQRRQLSVRKLDFGSASKEEDDQEQDATNGHQQQRRDSLAASPTKATATSPRRGQSPRKPLPQLPRSFSTMAAVSLHTGAAGAHGDPAVGSPMSSSPPAIPPLPSVTSAVPTSPPSPSTVARNEANRASDAEQSHSAENENAREVPHDATGNDNQQPRAHTESAGAGEHGVAEAIQTEDIPSRHSEVKARSDENSTVLDVDWATVDDKRRRVEMGDSDEEESDEEGHEDNGNTRVDPDELRTTPAGEQSPHNPNGDDAVTPTDNKEDEESETLSLKSFHHSFSLGVDAKISMAFHLAREAKPDAFTSRGMNKFKYFTQGINSILEGGCKNLSQGIEFIAIDDNVIHGDELPSSIESIVFSNIPAYADGTDLWGSARPFENMKPQKVDDKIIEVVAHKGSIHLIQIKAGVSKSISLGQGRKVKLQTKAILPMQLDGEPWLQGPALIEIEHFSQVKMLVPVKKKQRLTAEGKCDH